MIKYLVMDVDGTLTDGKIYMGNDGEMMKAFSIKDGCGIHDIAVPHGIIPVIITGRTSKIVENRCKELGIKKFYQAVDNKLEQLLEVTSDLSQVAYVGDDLNDITCMVAVKNAGGFVGCPLNACDKVKDLSDYVSLFNGGDGAVRDFIEWIIKKES